MRSVPSELSWLDHMFRRTNGLRSLSMLSLIVNTICCIALQVCIFHRFSSFKITSKGPLSIICLVGRNAWDLNLSICARMKAPHNVNLSPSFRPKSSCVTVAFCIGPSRANKLDCGLTACWRLPSNSQQFLFTNDHHRAHLLPFKVLSLRCFSEEFTALNRMLRRPNSGYFFTLKSARTCSVRWHKKSADLFPLEIHLMGGVSIELSTLNCVLRWTNSLASLTLK